MAAIDTAALKDALSGIGKELLDSGTLNADERKKAAEWTAAMAVAVATGDAAKVKNYRTALGAMLGVAELRAAQAGEKAALRLANLALDLLVKVAVAAVV